MSDWEGRTALVTGGSSGIGLALVSRLAEKAVKVLTTGRREEAWEKVLQHRPELRVVQFRAVDMRDAPKLVALVDEIREAHGHLDILVNNAGILTMGATHEMRGESVSALLDVLLEGPMRLTQAALRLMLEKDRGGHIVNISSTVATMPAPKMAVYGAAKAAILHFTRSIAAEYAAHGIRANAVLPGPVETNLASELALAQFARSSPAGRLGQPDEIVDLILYLLDPASNYVNGSAFTIDGGMALGPIVTPPHRGSRGTHGGTRVGPPSRQP